ncbi:MAG: hypothetical protein K0V04_15365, partial [Deltaproteobacteria bacterium]|nr:hypothetical protein [Deltaproteobacteria bacterium]
MSAVVLAMLAPGCYHSIDPEADAWEGLVDRSDDWVEVHKPMAPAEPRTWRNGETELRAMVVDGDVIMDGDIVLGTEDEVDAMFAADALTFRGVGRDNHIWNMPVKYSFANSVSDDVRDNIELALARVVAESDADISFKPCKGLCLSSHIKFKWDDGGGCSSAVGRNVWPAINKVRLEQGCDGVSDV